MNILIKYKLDMNMKSNVELITWCALFCGTGRGIMKFNAIASSAI